VPIVDPQRVTIATVFENHPLAAQEAEILFRTLIRYGGALTAARRVACAVGSVDQFYVEVLSEFDVEVVVVEPIDHRYPAASLLRALECADDSCDVILAVAPDIAFAEDISAWISSDAISARAGSGVDAGVLSVPARHCAQLRSDWLYQLHRLLDGAPDASAEDALEQQALAIALEQVGVPIIELPVEIGFTPYLDISAQLYPNQVMPFVVRHAHHLQPDSGELMHTPYELPNRVIGQINDSFADDVAPSDTHSSLHQSTSPGDFQ